VAWDIFELGRWGAGAFWGLGRFEARLFWGWDILGFVTF
jgi:hypothetical protein